MDEYRLLIVDADEAYAKRVANYLSGIEGFKIVGTVPDGASAMQVIKKTKPEAILLDPLLPGIDGLSLLRFVQSMKKPPVVVCISETYTSLGIELARRHGANYYVYKPIEDQALAFVLTECCKMSDEKRRLETMQEEINSGSDLSRRIYNLLHGFGFSFKHKGSEYMAKSIELASQSPMVLHNITVGIYQRIAEEQHISPASIERNMRTAIASVDSDGKLTAKIGAAPTNKNCIRYLLRELELQS